MSAARQNLLKAGLMRRGDNGCAKTGRHRTALDLDKSEVQAVNIAADNPAIASAGHNIPWGLRETARVAARNMDDYPVVAWGSGEVIRQTRCAVAKWCANHVGQVEVIETEDMKMLRFPSAAGWLMFRLRWL